MPFALRCLLPFCFLNTCTLLFSWEYEKEKKRMVWKISFTSPYSSPDRQLSTLVHLRLNLNIWSLGVWAQVCQVTLEMETLKEIRPDAPPPPRSPGEAVRVPDAAPWGETGCRCVLYPFLLPPRQTVLSWSSGTVRRKSKEKVAGQRSPCAPGEACSFSSLAALLSALITLVTNPGRASVIAKMYLRLHRCMHRSFKSWKH